VAQTATAIWRPRLLMLQALDLGLPGATTQSEGAMSKKSVIAPNSRTVAYLGVFILL